VRALGLEHEQVASLLVKKRREDVTLIDFERDVAQIVDAVVGSDGAKLTDFRTRSRTTARRTASASRRSRATSRTRSRPAAGTSAA